MENFQPSGRLAVPEVEKLSITASPAFEITLALRRTPHPSAAGRRALLLVRELSLSLILELLSV
jgi:hypothetical protein